MKDDRVIFCTYLVWLCSRYKIVTVLFSAERAGSVGLRCGCWHQTIENNAVDVRLTVLKRGSNNLEPLTSRSCLQLRERSIRPEGVLVRTRTYIYFGLPSIQGRPEARSPGILGARLHVSILRTSHKGSGCSSARQGIFYFQ